MINRILGPMRDFISIREKCVFCKGPLTINLTNFSNVLGKSIPIIKSTLNKNRMEFRFPLKHDGERFSFNVEVVVCLNSNSFNYTDLQSQQHIYHGISEPLPLSNTVVVNIFSSMKPHIELECQNRKCKMGYYLTSGVFQITDNLNIRPVGLMMECFTHDNLWMMNDHFSGTLYIYPKNNTGGTPIVAEHVDFDKVSIPKLLNRLKTLVIFS